MLYNAGQNPLLDACTDLARYQNQRLETGLTDRAIGPLSNQFTISPDKAIMHTVRDLVNAMENAIMTLGIDRGAALAAFKAKVAKLEA